MNDSRGSSGDVEPEERDDLARLARRLREARPVPAPEFLGRLRRAIIDGSRSDIEDASRVRARVAGFGLAGILLLALAVIGAGGAGPFGG